MRSESSPSLRRNRQLLDRCVALLSDILQTLHGVRELADPGKVASDHSPRATLSSQTVDRRQVVLIREQPVLNGRADFEHEACKSE